MVQSGLQKAPQITGAFPIPRASQGSPGSLSSPQSQQTFPPSRPQPGHTEPGQAPSILGGGPACDKACDDS